MQVALLFASLEVVKASYNRSLRPDMQVARVRALLQSLVSVPASSRARKLVMLVTRTRTGRSWT